MEANKKDLSGLFRQKIFDIPIYQRGYDWKGVNFDALWQDINFCIDNNKSLFLGTVILQRNKAGDIDFEENYFVVDGQQRLTTMTILLVAIKRALRERASLYDGETSNQLELKSAMINNNFLNVLNSDGESVRQRLNATKYRKKRIVNALNYICGPTWDGDFPKEKIYINGKERRLTQEFNRFIEVYNDFDNKLNKKNDSNKFDIGKERLTKLYEVLTNAEFVEIVVSSESEALYLFEVVNARGKDLEIADLLKNFFFSQMEDWEVVEKHWNTIIDNAENAGGITRMLKYFYVSRKGGDGSGSRELYDNIKLLVKGNNYLSLLENVNKFSDFYQKIRRGDRNQVFEVLKLDDYGEKSLFQEEINARDMFTSIELLRDCKITQTDPLIFSFFYKFYELCHDNNKLNGTFKKIRKYPITFLASLEHLHYINYGLGNRRANDIEKLYQDIAKELFNSNDVDSFRTALNELYKNLKKLRDDRETFVNNFTKKLYYRRNDTIHKLILYTFDKLERSVNNTTFEKIYSPKAPNDVSQDHWADQNDTKDDEYEVIRNSIINHTNEYLEENSLNKIDNIGNLLPVGHRLNSDLANRKKVFPKSPHSKFKYLEAQAPEYLLQKKFLETYSLKNDEEGNEIHKENFKTWGPEDIDKRAEDLANEIYDVIEKTPINT
ncbi:MAG: DUF262 domain-containing protein [Flammeovirgaceae bacterium]